jgi:hypothetical protein
MTRLSRLHVVVGALFASVAVNGLQGTRILKLEEALNATRPTERPLEGTILPPLDVKTTDGSHRLFNYGSAGKPTLLYIMSPSCLWCERNAASFQALSHRIGGRIQLIALTLSDEGLEAFQTQNSVDYPIYSPSASTLRSYRLGETPTTILVSESGQVVRIWSGTYTGLTRKSIENYFNVQLPPS